MAEIENKEVIEQENKENEEKEEYITMLVPKKYRDATLILGISKDLGQKIIKVPEHRYHDFTKLGFRKIGRKKS